MVRVYALLLTALHAISLLSLGTLSGFAWCLSHIELQKMAETGEWKVSSDFKQASKSLETEIQMLHL